MAWKRLLREHKILGLIPAPVKKSGTTHTHHPGIREVETRSMQLVWLHQWSSRSRERPPSQKVR